MSARFDRNFFAINCVVDKEFFYAKVTVDLLVQSDLGVLNVDEVE